MLLLELHTLTQAAHSYAPRAQVNDTLNRNLLTYLIFRCCSRQRTQLTRASLVVTFRKIFSLLQFDTSFIAVMTSYISLYCDFLCGPVIVKFWSIYPCVHGCVLASLVPTSSFWSLAVCNDRGLGFAYCKQPKAWGCGRLGTIMQLLTLQHEQ